MLRKVLSEIEFRNGMPPKALAELIGVSRNHYYDIKHGRKPLLMRHVDRLQDGVTLSERQRSTLVWNASDMPSFFKAASAVPARRAR